MPYRTQDNRVADCDAYALPWTMIFSWHSLVAPYRLTGLTALSVDSAMTRATPVSIAASTTCCAPSTFVCTASNGLYSHAGTCFMRRGVDDEIGTVHGAKQPAAVADVADEEAKVRIRRVPLLHLVLLELVAREDSDGGVGPIGDGTRDEGVAERSRAACQQDGGAGEVHVPQSCLMPRQAPDMPAQSLGASVMSSIRWSATRAHSAVSASTVIWLTTVPVDEVLEHPAEMGGVDPEHRRARADQRVERHDGLAECLVGEALDEVDLGADADGRTGGTLARPP